MNILRRDAMKGIAAMALSAAGNECATGFAPKWSRITQDETSTLLFECTCQSSQERHLALDLLKRLQRASKWKLESEHFKITYNRDASGEVISSTLRYTGISKKVMT